MIVLPLFLLALLAVCGVIVAGLIYPRTRAATGVIVLVLGFAVVTGGGVLWVYRSSQAGEHETQIARRVADEQRAFAVMPQHGADEIHIDWSDRATKQLPASTYPSQRAAAEAIVTEIIDRVNAVGELDRPVTHLFLTGDTETTDLSRSRTEGYPGIEQSLLFTIESRLRESFASVTIEANTRSPQKPRGDNPVTIDLKLSRRPQRDAFGQSYTGTITATIKGPQRTTQAAVAYEDKPWVEQFEAFTTAHRERRWYVGHTDGPEATETEAFDKAVRDAAAQLEPIVQGKLDTQTIEGAKLTQRTGWLRQQIEERLRNASAADVLVIDRFTQRFARPYGDVYATQLLVGVNDDALAVLARDANQQLAGYRRTTWTSLTSVVGLFVVAMLIYVVLNAITRGYYAGRLRAATVLFIAMGVGLLVMMLR